jgi:peptidoglycan L-alanyl-D-glutamate endopeptidase CwlK
VVEKAITLTTQDFMVNEGVRTKARQKELYAQGRTKPGDIVTWTMNSRHFAQADGYGHAVDLYPWPIDYKTTSKYDAIAMAMFRAAAMLGLHIRWGADWDSDGKPREKGETDSPHFEI